LEFVDEAIGIDYQANKKENTDTYIDSFKLSFLDLPLLHTHLTFWPSP
jgi:hypothetical protein